MRKPKTIVVTALFLVIGILLAYPLTLYATAWYHRWKAERLLAAVRSLHVGVTTRAEYERTVDPFVSDADRIRDGETDQPIPGAYGIATIPEWMLTPILHLSARSQMIMSNWSVIEGALFTIVPTFKDDRLTAIALGEEQGSGHPFGGFVTIHAGRVERLSPDDTLAFSGYAGRSMGGGGTVMYTNVDMDDRATPEQRHRALDFRFNCFTSFRPCTDGRQLLDPIITDN